MTNCVFANAIFGWRVERFLNLKRMDTVNDYLELQDKADNDSEGLSDKEDLQLQTLESQYEIIKLELQTRFNLRSLRAIHLCSVTDAWRGSHTSNGFLLGVGFPAIVEFTLENPAVVREMLERGAAWHHWVTGEE